MIDHDWRWGRQWRYDERNDQKNSKSNKLVDKVESETKKEAGGSDGCYGEKWRGKRAKGRVNK